MKGLDEIYLRFSEIISGFSPVNDDVFGEIFVKHTSYLDSLKTEKQYSYALKDARDKNLPLNSEKVKQLISQGFWATKDENYIDNTLKFINGMKETISKEFLLSKRKMLKKEVDRAEKQLEATILRKDFLLGLTAEKYARRQSIYHQIINSFYLDENLTIRLPEDKLNDDEVYNQLTDIYANYNNKLNIDIIKKIATSSFFINIFNMSGDNAYYFYGKPIVSLTGYQSDLFAYGRYFKGLMQQYGDRLPKEMSENPDDMIEFFEITQNVEKSGILKDDGQNNVAATSIVGATKQDLELMGVNPSQITSISKDLQKSGKTFLSKDELIKLKQL